jgi:hypothetical protein
MPARTSERPKEHRTHDQMPAFIRWQRADARREIVTSEMMRA